MLLVSIRVLHSNFHGQDLRACLDYFLRHKYFADYIYSSGGKAGAPTILTDEAFNIALVVILKKDKQKIQLSIEFDTDSMSGFRIEQPVRIFLSR
jgi:hypothetical protein